LLAINLIKINTQES